MTGPACGKWVLQHLRGRLLSPRFFPNARPVKNKQGCGFCRKNGWYISPKNPFKWVSASRIGGILWDDWWMVGWALKPSLRKNKWIPSTPSLIFDVSTTWNPLEYPGDLYLLSMLVQFSSCMFIAPSTARMGYRDTFPNRTGWECQVHKVKQRQLGNHQPACCILTSSTAEKHHFLNARERRRQDHWTWSSMKLRRYEKPSFLYGGPYRFSVVGTYIPPPPSPSSSPVLQGSVTIYATFNGNWWEILILAGVMLFHK